jgi:dTDP-4-amino-4,6-dideoxygalactose transaminase
MNSIIPFSNPYASYQLHKKEIDTAIQRVLDSGWYVLGKELEAFEKEFANFHGEQLFAVGVANGTDAIALCLRSLGMGKNDEIITVSHTAVATIAGIEQGGCTPVFADIDPNSRCIDPDSIVKRITKNTRAIMPVHIYGQPCEMKIIAKIADDHNLEIIEDCSQAHGAEIEGQKVGTFGSLAAFSCYPTKNLGGTGDGGIILAKSERLTKKLQSIRQYGWNQERESTSGGYNSRLDEMQAAILRVKLQYLQNSNEKRRHIAHRYNSAFKGLPITLPTIHPDELHAMHLYVIEVQQRDKLLHFLKEQGIGASLHYPLPVHLHKAYANRIPGNNDLGVTENFYQKHLTLPMFPELENEQVDQIIKHIQSWFNNLE